MRWQYWLSIIIKRGQKKNLPIRKFALVHWTKRVGAVTARRMSFKGTDSIPMPPCKWIRHGHKVEPFSVCDIIKPWWGSSIILWATYKSLQLPQYFPSELLILFSAPSLWLFILQQILFSTFKVSVTPYQPVSHTITLQQISNVHNLHLLMVVNVFDKHKSLSFHQCNEGLNVTEDLRHQVPRDGKQLQKYPGHHQSHGITSSNSTFTNASHFKHISNILKLETLLCSRWTYGLPALSSAETFGIRHDSVVSIISVPCASTRCRTNRYTLPAHQCWHPEDSAGNKASTLSSS